MPFYNCIMADEIREGRIFYIISNSIDNAEKCTVTELLDDCFKVQLRNTRRYEPGSAVELFSSRSGNGAAQRAGKTAKLSSGRIYFETAVKAAEGDILSIWHPLSIKHLQRREYARISEKGAASLHDDTGAEIKAEISNISPGGMQIKTEKQLELLKSYKTALIIDNKEIEAEFEPARIETSQDCFVISGRFLRMRNDDRINLARSCFAKQIERMTDFDAASGFPPQIY